MDPMKEEAIRTHRPSLRRSTRALRSVEPTVPIADPAALHPLDGVRGTDTLTDGMGGRRLLEEQTEQAGAAQRGLYEAEKQGHQCEQGHQGEQELGEVTVGDVGAEDLLQEDLDQTQSIKGQLGEENVSNLSVPDIAETVEVQCSNNSAIMKRTVEVTGNLILQSDKYEQQQQAIGADSVIQVDEDGPHDGLGLIENLSNRPQSGVGPTDGSVHDVALSPVRCTTGIDFDLNIECVLTADQGISGEPQVQAMPSTTRTVLGTAEGRLNKEGRESSGHKAQGRGVARFAVPLKKSLLCNPTARPKTSHSKKVVGSDEMTEPQTERRHGKASTRGCTQLTVDDQAVALLIKASGVTEGIEKPTELAQQQFGEKFVNALDGDTVGDMRATFGLQEVEGTGSIGALALDADD
ncbi:unnamed protein product [Urochloa humidicola]